MNGQPHKRDFEVDVDGKALPEASAARVHEALTKALHEELTKSDPSFGQGARPAADVKGHGKIIRKVSQ